MDTRAYRTYQAVILGGLAVFLVAKIVDGGILLYVDRRIVLLVLLTALVLIVLAQWALRIRLEPSTIAETSVEDRAGGSLALWLLALPLLAGLLLPQHAPEFDPPTPGAALTRTPGVLYLSPVDAPELWFAPLDGSPRPLTQTGGSLFDYSVSPDREWILYSQVNDNGGSDLWEMRRDGSDARMLLPCGADWCMNPALAGDGQRLAYSRRQASALPGEGPGVPRLWLLDRGSQETSQLHANPNVGGFEPAWSPDGRWLAYFDGLSFGVRVYDSQNQTDTLLPSQMGITGTWSPDGFLYFLDYKQREESPSVLVKRFEPVSGQTEPVFGDTGSPLDYSLPAVAPDGSQAAIALRPLSGGSNKQIWLLPLDGRPGTPLIEDALHHYAAYSWDPTGERLLLQRLEANRSDSRPQVVIWEGGALRVLAEDAYQPRWLP
jgi:dipeptidyl aminopeptidase/acylaminoacyl peptidase